MPAKKKSTKQSTQKSIDSITHESEKRKNIPTVEHRSFMDERLKNPIQVAYTRRNPDLDPQLIWKGKELLDEDNFVVQAPPLYIQEKIHPKVILNDLLRETKKAEKEKSPQFELFGDFNGIPQSADKTEYYQHDQNWTNRMILGDSLQVMASLSEREGLKGKVQCIYLDPPYGIKFNSNFQWSTTSRDVKDNNANHITREPEQVKAFRDTWKEGIHSYLTYLRDRLLVAKDLLHDSGSIFVQIGDENVHRVRAIMDEVFGDENFISMIAFKTSVPLGSTYVPGILNYLIYFAKNKNNLKFKRLFLPKLEGYGAYNSILLPNGKIRSISVKEQNSRELIPKDVRYVFNLSMLSAGRTVSCVYDAKMNGQLFEPGGGKSWKTNNSGLDRLIKAERIYPTISTVRYILFHNDYPVSELTDNWNDSSAASDKNYVVQTNDLVIQRCILMATDPGDIVLDPTCGSGTTAYVSEQWGRRWITIDTSRVALALARARMMGARYPYYLLADSAEGQKKEAEITRTTPSSQPVYHNIKHGFVYEKVPHITLKSIANNTEIDVIWEKWKPKVEGALKSLNSALRGHKKPYRAPTGGREGKDIRFDAKASETTKLQSGEEVPSFELLDWEVPREIPEDWPSSAKTPLESFWEYRIARQKEIDASIASRAEMEKLVDKPYENKSIVRVAGPFTVESLSPHRMISAGVEQPKSKENTNFLSVILENLKTAGVQHARKEDKIEFLSVSPYPGDLVCAEGRYISKEGKEMRAGIFVGPEYATVTRPDLVEAAREASEMGFQILIACAFNYEAQVSEFDKLGKIPILKARMNADLHMAEDLRNNGKGNLFVVFGEPDIEIQKEKNGELIVQIKGVDVFDPNSGEVRSDGPEGIACWFVDTDYNEESFFVRQAYFLGAGDPYKSLKTSLKAEINAEAWESLYSDTSRPFSKPESGRIAVKVINHLGDEVMKVFKV